jgi:hypothetical protein
MYGNFTRRLRRLMMTCKEAFVSLRAGLRLRNAHAYNTSTGGWASRDLTRARMYEE